MFVEGVVIVGEGCPASSPTALPYFRPYELDEGGMATVYLADDIKHNRSVALKVLKPELAAVVGAERFLAEIQVTADLNPGRGSAWAP